MTDTKKPASLPPVPPTPNPAGAAPAARGAGFSSAVFKILLPSLLILAAAAGLLALRAHETGSREEKVAYALLERRVAILEQQLQNATEKLNALSLAGSGPGAGGEAAADGASSDAASAAPPSPSQKAATAVPPQPPGPSAETVARLQSDIVALAAAVSGVQGEIKQVGTRASQTQQTAEASLAAIIAFIQLREAANSGRGFASEIAGLRLAAAGRPSLLEPLAALDPYAAQGAPTLEQLRESFLAFEPQISLAIDKGSAGDWWARVKAELKGLVTIRPLHGQGTSDLFDAAELGLLSGDLSATLAALDALPGNARETLKAWRAKAEARQTIDLGLHRLGDRLIAQGASADSSGRAEPPAARTDQPESRDRP
ncbi:MAG: hypothetical protein M3N08_03990 [Pseudomonadota bacterium]|nr:hypothetical protein [Pseudomonadota bacterium]